MIDEALLLVTQVGMLLFIVAGLGLPALLWFMRLQVRLDDELLSLRFRPFLRFLPWSRPLPWSHRLPRSLPWPRSPLRRSHSRSSIFRHTPSLGPIRFAIPISGDRSRNSTHSFLPCPFPVRLARVLPRFQSPSFVLEGTTPSLGMA